MSHSKPTSRRQLRASDTCARHQGHKLPNEAQPSGSTSTASRNSTLIVNKLRIEGATLDPKEMFDVFTFLDRSADARSVLNAVAERFPSASARRGAQIGEFRNLLRDLEGKINPDGSVADTASVALNRIRRDIERQKKHIQDSLERFMKAHQEEGVLQEDFITIRSERFVVPIIAGQHKKLKGVVHGASSSGHTLFVEPLETIDLNDDLVRLTEEEMREVHRILREMTERLRGYSDAIRTTLDVMSRLELVFGKGEIRHRVRLFDSPIQSGIRADADSQERPHILSCKTFFGSANFAWFRSRCNSTRTAGRY